MLCSSFAFYCSPVSVIREMSRLKTLTDFEQKRKFIKKGLTKTSKYDKMPYVKRLFALHKAFFCI